MRRASILLNLYGRQAVHCKLNLLAKNAFLVFFGVNRAYIREPENHIGWAKWMPFTSINPTHPNDQFVKFWGQLLSFWWWLKTRCFFWVGHLIFFFCFIPIYINHKLTGTKDATKFWCLPWFPTKSLGYMKIWETLYISIQFSYV